MTNCYLCGSTSYTDRPGSVRDNPDLRILECTSCGLVYLSSFDHIQARHYERSGMHGNEVLPVEQWLKETEWDDDRRFRFFQAKLVNKKILDFGCGCGGFLLKARSLADGVRGIEPELRLQEFFNQQKLQVDTSIESLQYKESKFDLITAFHVIEHLPDPRSILQKLSLLLNEGGEVVIEVPNADDALLALFNCDPFRRFTYWSQHLFLFNSRTLSALIRQAGFKLRWLQQVQRYPLSNHLHWLAKGKPGGHQIWAFMDSNPLNQAYADRLAALGHCDTLMAGIGR